jgi:hypothetical protein
MYLVCRTTGLSDYRIIGMTPINSHITSLTPPLFIELLDPVPMWFTGAYIKNRCWKILIWFNEAYIYISKYRYVRQINFQDIYFREFKEKRY